MKIMILTDSLGIGGSEKVLVSLANSFSKHNSTTFVIVKKKNFYKSQLSKNIKIKKLNCSRTIYSFFKIYYLIKNNSFDVILSNLTHINLILIFINIFLKKQKIIIRETTYLSSKIKSNYNFISFFFLRYIISFLYKRANQLVVMCQDMKKDLIENFKIDKNKINIIYNPFDYLKIQKQSEEKINKKYYFTDKKYIISVGRLVKEKGFVFLIKAFNKIKNKTTTNLVIIGDGYERKLLQKLIKKLKLKKRVFLIGFKKNPYKFIKKAQLYVLTSIREGFPNTLVEAIMLNTPVLSYNCKSGPDEIIKKFKTGKLVNNYNMNFFSRKILEELKKKRISGVKYKNNIHKVSMKFFDYKIISNKYFEILNK